MSGERPRSRMIGGGGEARLPFDRLARSLAIRDFLTRIGWGGAERRISAGDASARALRDRHAAGVQPRVLMNSPRLVLGPPVRDGKPYAEIAHTAAVGRGAFVAIDRALAGRRSRRRRRFCAGSVDQAFC